MRVRVCVQREHVHVLMLKRKTDIAETENYKVACVCRLNSIMVKGNKGNIRITFSFDYRQSQCKEGSVELQIVHIKYVLKMGQDMKCLENLNIFFCPHDSNITSLPLFF